LTLQALDFGRYLRWRYHMVHSLLPGSWQDGTVVARTTSYQRTIATLQVGPWVQPVECGMPLGSCSAIEPTG